jgi:hypothetical protein
MDLVTFLSLAVAAVIAVSGYLLFFDPPMLKRGTARRRR